MKKIPTKKTNRATYNLILHQHSSKSWLSSKLTLSASQRRQLSTSHPMPLLSKSDYRGHFVANGYRNRTLHLPYNARSLSRSMESMG